MSLLDKGRETVIVYPTETYIDPDGNISKRASTTGIVTPARIWPAAQSGTSSRRAEQDNEGFETEQIYLMHLPRSFTHEIGIAAQIDWNGERWHVMGHPRRYNGSPRTAHKVYMIRRT